ncbi:hypothetical protein ACFRAU_07520 [Arthrobacter sp. NPDC056691]|uniref:hypothetical protein n=1 Tax=Arthrobacter sp. NPDC056691 TaxID=3345913 RepID=UPI003671F5B0
MQWIDRARAVHGDKYDYSRVEYADSKTKVVIICRQHGVFEQIPVKHVSARRGCRACAGLAPPSTSEWIERAHLVHGDRFGYECVRYVNSRTNVTIRCPEHGYFEQTPKSHVVNEHGCPRCIGRGLSTPEWIGKARTVHGNKYDYSAVEYATTTKPVVIICGEHGPFEQTPSVHVKDRCGCPKCSGHGLSSVEWIARARSVHGDAYDYWQFVYAGPYVKCEVICREHGVFRQTVTNHIHNRAGCPLCGGPKGEKLIALVLDDLGFAYRPQWSHPTCRDRSRLLFDFYLPSLRALIEFDGLQHFEPVKWCASMTAEQAEGAFLVIQRRNRIKTDWAAINGYHLLRVRDVKRAATQVAEFVQGLSRRSSNVTHNPAENGALT